MDRKIRVFICNISRQQGDGSWLELPMDEAEIRKRLKEIEITPETGEIIITDYDIHFAKISNLDLGEHEDVYALNLLAKKLEEMTDECFEVYRSIINSGIGLPENGSRGLLDLVQNMDCYNIYADVKTAESVGRLAAETILGEVYIPKEILHKLQMYLDYEALGNDTMINENGMLTDSGYIVRNENTWIAGE